MSEAGFLSALRDDPDDATSRLIAADWQEDHGDPFRAELLRIQVELDGWVPDREKREALQKRRQELLTFHAPRWLGLLHDTAHRWDFHHGLFQVTLKSSVLLGRRLKSITELYQQGWVGKLHLLIEQPRLSMARLARTPRLQGIVDLDLSGNQLTDADLETLLESFHLDSVRRLNLSNNALTNDAVSALHRAGMLRRLVALDLRNNLLGSAALELLLSEQTAPELRELEVQGNGFEAPLLIEVANWCRDRGMAVWQGTRPRRVINSLGMEFELIPAGTFRMGSPDQENDHRDHEGPLRTVRLTRPYYLSRYLTTQQQYEKIMGTNPSFFRTGPSTDLPVDSVSFEAIQNFLHRLGQQPAEIHARRAYRLPYEGEWEHACRSGTTTPFWWGEVGTAEDGNFDGTRPYNTRRITPYLQQTCRGGSYPANPFGLYDTHGNLWEWCLDYYEGSHYREGFTEDPIGPREGNRRVLRGGSWHSDAPWCRAAYRCSDGEGSIQNWYGFRVLLEVLAQ